MKGRCSMRTGTVGVLRRESPPRRRCDILTRFGPYLYRQIIFGGAVRGLEQGHGSLRRSTDRAPSDGLPDALGAVAVWLLGACDLIRLGRSTVCFDASPRAAGAAQGVACAPADVPFSVVPGPTSTGKHFCCAPRGLDTRAGVRSPARVRRWPGDRPGRRVVVRRAECAVVVDLSAGRRLRPRFRLVVRVCVLVRGGSGGADQRAEDRGRGRCWRRTRGVNRRRTRAGW